MEPAWQRRIDELALGAPFYAEQRTYVRSSGWYRRRDYHSIALVTEGTAQLATCASTGEPRPATLRTGEMLFLSPSEMTIWNPDRSETFAVAFVAFPAFRWRSFAGMAGLDVRRPGAAGSPRASTPHDVGAAAHAFQFAVERFHDSPTIFDLIRFWAMTVPDLFGADATSPRNTPFAPAWLVESVEMMREESNLRIGLPRFVELAHVSTGHLAVATRRYYGRTPSGLIMELRLQHATDLLRTSSLTVREIAERCGFQSLTYFSNSFRGELGVSPRAYRSASAGFGPAPLAELNPR